MYLVVSLIASLVPRICFCSKRQQMVLTGFEPTTDQRPDEPLATLYSFGLDFGYVCRLYFLRLTSVAYVIIMNFIFLGPF